MSCVPGKEGTAGSYSMRIMELEYAGQDGRTGGWAEGEVGVRWPVRQDWWVG